MTGTVVQRSKDSLFRRGNWERAWSIAGRVRIRWKILGIAVGSVILLGAVLMVNDRQSTRNELRAELRAKATSIARQFAAANTDAVLTNNLFGLHQALQIALESDPDLSYAFIHGPDGEILADTFSWGVPKALEPLLNDPDQEGQTVPIGTEHGLVWDASAPMLDGRAGWTHVGLSEQRLQAVVSERTRETALLTLLAVTLATVGAFGLATVLSAPILRLKQAAEDVAGGDLHQQVEVWARDEIGELTTAFNTMTRELEASRQTLMRQNRELRALNAVASSVASSSTLTETLDAALAAVRDVLGVDAAWVFLTNQGETLLARQSGLPDSVVIDHVTSGQVEDCICLRVLESGQPVLSQDRPGACGLLSPGVVEKTGLECHATIPIRSRGTVLGVLSVASHVPRPFDEADVRLLEAVGTELGIAVDNAALWEEVRQRDEMRGRLIDRIFEAQEEERRRIAREIHDHTNQVLSSLIVSVDVAQNALSEKDERLGRVLATTRAECEATLTRLDDLVVHLRPKLLDDLGLAAGLEWLLQEFGTRSAVPTELRVDGLQARIAPDVETAAFRITQEALVNVARHADAGHVAVEVRSADGVLELSIADDGCGFEPARVPGVGTRHFGLLGMYERAELAGGRLVVSSEAGKGTRVEVSLPVRGVHA